MPEGRKKVSEATIFSAYPVSRAGWWRCQLAHARL